MKDGALWTMVGQDVYRFTPGDRVAFLSENAYAQYDVASESSVVPLPDELSGKPFPAEPLGCAMNIFRAAGSVPGTRSRLWGSGFWVRC